MRIREILLAAAVVHLALSFGPQGTESAVGVEKGSLSPVALTEGSDCMLVVFLDPECPLCGDVYAQAHQSARAGSPDVELLWVMPEEERGQPHAGAFADLSQITFADSLFSLFEVSAVPSAVLVQNDEVLGAGGIPPESDLRSFARSCAPEPAGTPAVATVGGGPDARLGARKFPAPRRPQNAD